MKQDHTLNQDNPHKRFKFHFDHLFFNDPRQYGPIVLYQIGDLSCESGYVIGEHRQFCYEISYIVSGKGTFSSNGRTFSVQEGDIVLNVPGELHDGQADREEPFRYFYVGFTFDEHSAGDAHSFLHIRKMFDQLSNPVVVNKVGIDVPFVSLFNELIHLNTYSPLMIETCLTQIIVLAYRNFSDHWAAGYSPLPETEESRPKHIVYEVINYIDVHLLNITELSAIAAELHYSYSYLSNLFSKETGLTMKEYYNRKRFEKANEWLQEGGISVTQIAEKLNYQSIHTFSKAFRNYFGISPTEYQAIVSNPKK